MNDVPRQQLCEILAHYGPALCDEPRRCEALLWDHCPEHRREIHLLVSALKERVPADLLGSNGGTPVALLLRQLTNRLEHNLAMTEDAARWSVQSWALALGVSTHADTTSPLATPGATSSARAGATPSPSAAAGRMDRLVVAPDGSGDVRGLEDAVRVAAPGATLVLRAGTHRLSRPLEIDQPLSLVGDGRESTYVVCASPGRVVQVSGNGRFAASDVTFTHEGAQVANVLEVACEELDLRHCGFLGGVSDEAAQSGGVGLLLEGQVRGTVVKYKASGNGSDGICVVEQAQPGIEGNTCQANKGVGIAYGGSAASLARKNTCSGNGHSGIIYYGRAAGNARNNTCRRNEGNGIVVAEQAQLVLEGNTCEGNTLSGIAYGGSTAGSARNNRCHHNEQVGIYAGEQAQPVLEGNTCEGNTLCGIGYGGSAAGSAHDNTCNSNKYHGIVVGQQAQPVLEGNTCERNRYQGIVYFGTASGVARNNTCRSNVGHGIHVREQAKPVLEGNTCKRNHGDGILAEQSAHSTGINNWVQGNGGKQVTTIDVHVSAEMLALMTEKQRIVVQLRMQGRSFKSIAAQLDIAEMSARTRFNRGMTIALQGRPAGQLRLDNIGGLTDDQVERLDLLNIYRSVQKVADHLGLNNQMTVRSSLNRAAEKLGCPDIWTALEWYLAAKARVMQPMMPGMEE